ncbi:MAG: hypothetical protein A2428_15870 [Bdellovibrionales bacterium RIFOXYC1_FULL_54_43]|nr:MAG: hypothetical protein A2428_15870 [Bdellovibrionales bacterium RIFOXYC1_FULL_54_43]OFZ82950.1 MAG: hypothetical protein A2603_11020 [Bdellovibrionales bacterium RIFOXYD1_FULL_55_31]
MKNLLSLLWTFALIFAPWLLLGALIGSIPGYKLYEYVWKNDKFCTSCHVHDYASIGWKSSIHGELTTCHDCHHQALIDYAREGLALISGNPKFPRDLHHTPYVPRHICEACHLTDADRSSLTGPLSSDEVDKLPKVDRLYLHNIHLNKQTRVPLVSTIPLGQMNEEMKTFGVFDGEPAPKLRERRQIICTDCHGGPANRAHDISVADRSCVRCHANTHRTQFVQQYGCRNCHYQDFLTPLGAMPSAAKIQD